MKIIYSTGLQWLKSFLGTLLVLLLISACQPPDRLNKDHAIAEADARSFISDLIESGLIEQLSIYGLETEEDIKNNLQFSTIYNVKDLDFASLPLEPNTQELQTAMQPTQQTVQVFRADGSDRGVVFFTGFGNEREASGVGGPEFIRGLDLAAEVLEQETRQKRDQFFLLNLRDLRLELLVAQHNNLYKVVPLHDNTSLGLVTSEIADLATLIPIFKEFDVPSYQEFVPSGAGASGALSDAAYRSAESVVPVGGSSAALSDAAYRASEKTSEKVLPLNLYPQEQDQWCWAASGKMVMTFMGASPSTIPECEQANRAFGRQDCCKHPFGSECNKPSYPHWSKWGFSGQWASGQLDWDRLVNYIDSQMPVIFLWRFNTGGAHFQIVKGYAKTKTGSRYVLINDPWKPNQGNQTVYSYEKLLGGSRFDHSIEGYWKDVRKQP